MPATPDELTWARSYIGSTETDDVFNERIDRLVANNYSDRQALLNASVEESLRSQLAALLLDQPSQASVGSVSYSNAANIQEMSKQFKEFQKLYGSLRLTSARLVRPRER